MGKTKQEIIRGGNTILPADIDIKDVLLSVTNFCLGSCSYCNLKSLKDFDYDKEITVADIERLLTDPLLDNMENIHITGGEPVLSPKTYEVFKLLNKYRPNIRVNMPVSGFFPETTYRYCKRLLRWMPQLRVDVSVDGEQKIHEITRGKGSWKPVMATIGLLSTLSIQVQLQLTVSRHNYNQITYVNGLAEELGFGFYVTFPHYSSRFGHKQDKPFTFSQDEIKIIDEQLRDRWCKIRPLNKQIWDIQKAEWEGKKVRFDCDMGKKSIDIDPAGNVYPCMVYSPHLCFGDIKKQSLSEIFDEKWLIARRCSLYYEDIR